jgi:type III restriction enzyme
VTIEIKFDANQQYQLDAVAAVVDLFAGQEVVEQSFTLPGSGDEFDVLPGFNELVFGNSLSLTAETLRKNLRAVQDRPLLTSTADERPSVPESLRIEVPDGQEPLDYSLEMETGTGKTYVYLRTIAQLHRRYGFSKFVIVVPSVAIREGVVTSLGLVGDHLRDLYDGLQLDHYVYDSNALTRVRQFATASHLQIMVINIDSFTKETNIINRASDAMNGYAPIEFLRACRPVVIMDEPQNMETEIRKAAIAALQPLFRVRYSATHRDPKHLVYRLTPVDAYDLRLVKRIGVRGITQDHDLNLPFIEVKKVNATPSGVTATAVIHKLTRQGTKPTQTTLRKDMDLVDESSGREIYRGWIVEDIVAGHDGQPGHVEFGNHSVLREGSATGEGQDQLHRIMIRQAIEAHFQRERDFMIKARHGTIAPTKALTLFFIDRVANYAPAAGKFRTWFEEEYQAVLADGKNRLLSMPPVSEVHNGYFATSPKGVAKDTREGQDTADASRAFELIMRDKESLLDLGTPLRFIFSHSALAEGWDNPNVFVICNLQDGKSVMRKRQQIGRGLRLPVMANGERCRVEEVNHLTVIANEAFETFASSLQKEIEDETGIEFGRGRIVDEKHRVKLDLKRGALEAPLFRALWDHISPRTTYRLQFDTPDLIADATMRVKNMDPITQLRFTVREGELAIDLDKGVGVDGAVDLNSEVVAGLRRIPDVLAELSRRTPVSRATIAEILLASGRLADVRINPSAFLDGAAAAMNAALYAQLTDGIVYTPSPGQRWEAHEFADHVGYAYEATLVEVAKSITAKIAVDSEVEREFAKAIDAREDVKLFLKLPSWFKVSTPLGGYNPDWAIVREEVAGTYLYLVRETKGGSVLEDLRFENEKLKIRFGEAHFHAIKVDYLWGKTSEELLGPIRIELGKHEQQRG